MVDRFLAQAKNGQRVMWQLGQGIPGLNSLNKNETSEDIDMVYHGMESNDSSNDGHRLSRGELMKRRRKVQHMLEDDDDEDGNGASSSSMVSSVLGARTRPSKRLRLLGKVSKEKKVLAGVRSSHNNLRKSLEDLRAEIRQLRDGSSSVKREIAAAQAERKSLNEQFLQFHEDLKTSMGDNLAKRADYNRTITELRVQWEGTRAEAIESSQQLDQWTHMQGRVQMAMAEASQLRVRVQVLEAENADLRRKLIENGIALDFGGGDGDNDDKKDESSTNEAAAEVAGGGDGDDDDDNKTKESNDNADKESTVGAAAAQVSERKVEEASAPTPAKEEEKPSAPVAAPEDDVVMSDATQPSAPAPAAADATDAPKKPESPTKQTPPPPTAAPAPAAATETAATTTPTTSTTNKASSGEEAKPTPEEQPQQQEPPAAESKKPSPWLNVTEPWATIETLRNALNVAEEKGRMVESMEATRTRQYQELSDRLVEYVNKVAEVEATCRQHKDEVEEAEKRVLAKEEMSNVLRKEISYLKEEIKALNEHCKKQEDIIAISDECSASAHLSLQEVMAELRVWQKSCQTLQTSYTKVCKLLAQHDTREQELDTKCRELEEQVNVNERNRLAQAEELNALRQWGIGCEKELNDAEMRIGELEKREQEAREQHTQAQEKVREVEQALRDQQLLVASELLARVSVL